MRNYKIGEIAKLANVNIETIRFYERKNLIHPTKRLESGYRIFSDECPILSLINSDNFLQGE